MKRWIDQLIQKCPRKELSMNFLTFIFAFFGVFSSLLSRTVSSSNSFETRDERLTCPRKGSITFQTAARVHQIVRMAQETSRQMTSSCQSRTTAGWKATGSWNLRKKNWASSSSRSSMLHTSSTKWFHSVLSPPPPPQNKLTTTEHAEKSHLESSFQIWYHQSFVMIRWMRAYVNCMHNKINGEVIN